MGFLASLGVNLLKAYVADKRRAEAAARRKRKAEKRRAEAVADRKLVEKKQLNERWNRLNDILIKMSDEFGPQLRSVFNQLTKGERKKYLALRDEVLSLKIKIGSNINFAKKSDISIYATVIRRLSMKIINLCKKYGVASDVVSVEYDSKIKMIKINGEDRYYIG